MIKVSANANIPWRTLEGEGEFVALKIHSLKMESLELVHRSGTCFTPGFSKSPKSRMSSGCF
jgi:hypothetical protein